MTIELHLLRHAHAGNPAKWTAADTDRPLSAKGRDQSARIGAFLAAAGVEPDAVITSPKARAIQTAEIVAEALNLGVRSDERLAEGLSIAAIEEILSDAGDPARPVLVGHDPDFSAVLSLLVGAEEITLRKGAVARVDVERPLAPGSGLLRWLVPAELVPER